MTTSIDQAFQKAYAQRIPTIDVDNDDNSRAVERTSAIWIDEPSSEKSFRIDSGHGSRPGDMHSPDAPKHTQSDHTSEQSHDDSQSQSHDEGASTATIQPATEQSDGGPRIIQGTSAYDAWSERLESSEFSSPALGRSLSDRHDTGIPAEAPVALHGAFTPVWEVDRFHMPAIATTLIDEHLGSIGEQLHRAANEGLHCLAVTSLHRASGTSTFALSIAQAAASAGLCVALVDADTESPALADMLQLELDTDWLDAISQGESVERSTVVSLENGFSFVPLLNKEPEELKNADRYASELHHELSKHFDLIVVDFGPLQPSTFGLSLPLSDELFDAVVMVEDMRQADHGALESSARRIRAVGIDNIGLIENYVS